MKNTFKKSLAKIACLGLTLCVVQTTTAAAEMRVVLSIDGGGIRGIIPAMVLEELERQVGAPLTDVVDLFSGTSTGGILALGLNVPGQDSKPKYSAHDLVKLYEEKGEEIFKRPAWYSPRRLLTIGGYVRPSFTLDGMDKVFSEYFGNVQLNQTLKNVFITSYDLDYAQPYFFETKKAKKSPHDNFDVKDVAGATARAQTYVEMGEIRSKGGDVFNLIDGGNVANNPAELAYYNAKELYPDDDLLIVSLGTGDARQTLKSMSGGKISWAAPTIDLQMNMNSLMVDYRMDKIQCSADKKLRYYRIQKYIPAGDVNPDLADVSSKNIARLKEVGAKFVEGYLSNIEEIASTLKAIISYRKAVKEGETPETIPAITPPSTCSHASFEEFSAERTLDK